MTISIENCNWIDAVVLAFALWGVYWGIKRGLTGEILKIVGLLVAFIVAIKYCPIWTMYINETNWADDRVVVWLAFFLIFFLVALLFFIFAKILYLILRKTFLGWVDRFFGAIFGAVRGVIIVSVILTIAVVVVGEKASQIIEQKSFSGSSLVRGTRWAWNQFYKNQEQVSEPVQEIQDGIEENLEEITDENT